MGKIDPEDRFLDEPSIIFEDAFMAIDATACRIQRPRDNATQRLFYSGKHKAHVQKWEIGVRLTDGKICWVSKEYRGPVHDSRMFREGGLLNFLIPGEKVLGDKGYQGMPEVISPHRGRDLEETELLFNQILSSERIIVERVFGRMKEFHCLKNSWRASLEKQNWAFYVLACITNKKLEENPL